MLSEKDKLQGYIEIYRIQLERFDKRRDIEWKVNMAIWTSIVVVTGFLAGKVPLGRCSLLIYTILWIIYSFLWTLNSWYTNKRDMSHALIYLNRIEILLGYKNQENEFKKPLRKDFIMNWSRLSQIIFTGVLLFVSWYFLHNY